MRLLKPLFLLFSFLSLQAGIVIADLAPLPQPVPIIPTPPLLAAKSYLLIDYLSDHVITAQGIDERVAPASLTKIMTVYVAGHALKNNKIKIQDLVKISEKAWKTPGSRMFVEVNKEVLLEDLLQGIIIQSGNDASVAIAEHIAGSESNFVEMMNHYAKQLGMVNSHFVNVTGLPDPNHYSTAQDMAILAKALIRDFPDLYAIHAKKEFFYNNIKQENRNRLLWRNEWIDGIKTGHTEEAGYCMVASGQKDNMRLIAIVMGTKSDTIRTEETNKLLTYGFQFFETRKLYPAGTPLKKTRIWMGTEKEVTLGLAQDLYVTIGQGQYNNLKAAINIDNLIKAPALQGTVLGNLSIQLNDKTLIERPIVSLNTIPAGGILSRLYDKIALTFHTLLSKVSS